MKIWKKAKINWLTIEDGGRKVPIPVNTKYCPIIIYENSDQKLGSWSAEIVVETYNSRYISIAELSFLSEEAPFELLNDNAEFQLFEGSRLVANGQIVS